MFEIKASERSEGKQPGDRPRYLGSGAVKNHMTKVNATARIISSKWPSFRRKSRVLPGESQHEQRLQTTQA